MRGFGFACLAAAFVLLGCSEQGTIGTPPSPETQAESAARAAEGYTLEVLATEGDQIYVVSHPQTGEATAARVHNGASALLDLQTAQALLTERQAAIGAQQREVISFSVPGLSFSVRSDDPNSDTAQVQIQAGGQEVNVNADGSGAGENAVVRITGVDAQAARDFITEADGLDPGVQQQMLDALKL